MLHTVNILTFVRLKSMIRLFVRELYSEHVNFPQCQACGSMVLSSMVLIFSVFINLFIYFSEFYFILKKGSSLNVYCVLYCKSYVGTSKVGCFS